MRMRGYNVLFPMGFDAFGLPAENAAIKDGIHPMKRTFQNIERMRKQMRTMGAMFDWEREAVSADPRILQMDRVVLHSVVQRLVWPIAKCLPWTGARTATPRWHANRSGVMTVTANAAARLSSRRIWISGSSKPQNMPMSC
jgi:valyl-tRNA synthetase